jgi:hypothetical protein
MKTKKTPAAVSITVHDKLFMKNDGMKKCKNEQDKY